MNSYVYILLCKDGSYYIGSTNNLERRLSEHQSGCGANFTSKRLPVELVYYEEFPRIDDAFYREKQIQGWNRKKKEALINNKSKLLPLLSKNYTQFPRDSHLDKWLQSSVEALNDQTLVSEQFDTSTSSVSSELNESVSNELAPELAEGTSTNVETKRSYVHFDTSTSSVSSKLNDQTPVVELVETTEGYSYYDTSTGSVSSELNDSVSSKLNNQKIKKIEK